MLYSCFFNDTLIRTLHLLVSIYYAAIFASDSCQIEKLSAVSLCLNSLVFISYDSFSCYSRVSYSSFGLNEIYVRSSVSVFCIVWHGSFPILTRAPFLPPALPPTSPPYLPEHMTHTGNVIYAHIPSDWAVFCYECQVEKLADLYVK